jgi:hypothetical protein
MKNLTSEQLATLRTERSFQVGSLFLMRNESFPIFRGTRERRRPLPSLEAGRPVQQSYTWPTPDSRYPAVLVDLLLADGTPTYKYSCLFLHASIAVALLIITI